MLGNNIHTFEEYVPLSHIMQNTCVFFDKASLLDNCWKENKNRYLFSYLHALVELNVFEKVRCEFLVVGHTGNEVDQCFSILTNELKGVEIMTIEKLKEVILNAPIQPKPLCRSLAFIWDWKSHVTPKLADPPLVNHSKYNSFLVEKQGGHVKFRGKLLPQLPDTELVPRAGIRLVKEDTTFEPVLAADFRVGEIKFDDIFKGLRKFTVKLPLDTQMSVISSWERLRKSLESLPRQKETFKKLRLENLPKQSIAEEVCVPEHLKDAVDAVEYTLSGDLYPEEISEGDLKEVDIGTDVVVYTTEIQTRPWVGRVTKLLANQRFEINWFVKKSGRGQVFESMKDALGSPVASVIDLDSVMFWQMSEKRTEQSFTLAPFWVETVRMEYLKLDSSS